MKLHLALVALVALAACDDGPKESPKEKAEKAATQGADLKGGTKHDPPVEVEAIEEGHFYCDMGTVHYSRPDEGDGTCPLCGMDLTKKE